MGGATQVVQNTDADVIQYHRDLVRTKNCFPLGRAMKIAIGPSEHWRPAQMDPYVAKYGRLLELRNRPLPIAQQAGQMLVMAPLVEPDGRVGLPDIPDPTWMPSAYTEEEVTGKVRRDPAKDRPVMLTQRLTDRCEMMDGQPAVLDRSNFLIFQPVISVTFQPELQQEIVAEVWIAQFRPVAGRHCAFLVDHKTGEAFFFGGAFEILKPSGG